MMGGSKVPVGGEGGACARANKPRVNTPRAEPTHGFMASSSLPGNRQPRSYKPGPIGSIDIATIGSRSPEKCYLQLPPPLGRPRGV